MANELKRDLKLNYSEIFQVLMAEKGEKDHIFQIPEILVISFLMIIFISLFIYSNYIITPLFILLFIVTIIFFILVKYITIRYKDKKIKFVQKYGIALILILISISIYFYFSAFLNFSLYVDLLFLIIIGLMIGLVIHNHYKWLKINKLKQRFFLTYKESKKISKHIDDAIIWIRNNWRIYSIFLIIITLIPLPFIVYYTWESTHDLDFVAASCIYSIIPMAIIFAFIDSPISIGFSKKGIYGRFNRKLKGIGYSKFEEKKVYKFFKKIKWDDITYIALKDHPLKSIDHVLIFYTKKNRIFLLEFISEELLLEIYNHFKHHILMGNEYAPYKVKKWKYYFNNIPFKTLF